MFAPSVSVKALLVAMLAAVPAIANPIDIQPRQSLTPGGEQCGPVVCPDGTSCCNASCGICVKPGMACHQMACETVPPPKLEVCGSTICKPGTECCNPSCGTCVEPGKGCTKEFCAPKDQKCGKTVCGEGFFCCNSSCGICAPHGGACTQQYCTDE